MRLFTRAGYRPKRIETKKQNDGLLHLLTISTVGLCACLICLCGVSWAWFTATTSTGTAVIQSSSYKLAYQVNGAAATDFTEKAEITVPEGGQCSITLSATGTAGAAGYCSVQVGDETSYYTKPILVGDDASAFTFTVNAAEGTKIYLTPKWGSYSGSADLNSGDTIGITTGNTQETPMNAASTTEPATTTTTSAAPSSSPEESEAPTPDAPPADSKTAQTESVSGDEQAPASEDSNQ